MIAPWLTLLLSATSATPFLQPASAACPPAGYARDGLKALRSRGFEVADATERKRLATALLACIDDPDPQIRDEVVFEGLSKWLRAKALDGPTVVTLAESLSVTLAGSKDAGGFRLPFAALVLSEVVRVDRIEPVFTDTFRSALVDLAAASFTQVDDYRGFDEREGWRHGVAHGADLILQLGINPKVGPDGQRKLMDALRAQFSPPRVFYTSGEPERIARAVNFTYRRAGLDAAYWEAWFASLADPKPRRNWGASFETVEGMAARHNRLALAHAISFAGRTSNDDVGRALAALADKTATQIMGG